MTNKSTDLGVMIILMINIIDGEASKRWFGVDNHPLPVETQKQLFSTA